MVSHQKLQRPALHKDSAELEEGSPRPSQSLSQGPEGQESSAETCPQPQKRDDPGVTFHWPKTLWLRRQPKCPWRSAPRSNKLDHYAIVKFPHHHPVSHEENRRNQCSRVHCGSQGQQAPSYGKASLAWISHSKG